MLQTRDCEDGGAVSVSLRAPMLISMPAVWNAQKKMGCLEYETEEKPKLKKDPTGASLHRLSEPRLISSDLILI